MPVSPTATVLVSGCEGRPQGFLLLSVPRASHARPPNCSAPAVSRDDVTALEGACRQHGFSSRTTTNARRRLAWASWPGPPHERSDGRRQPFART